MPPGAIDDKDNTSSRLDSLKGRAAAGLLNSYNTLINFTPACGGVDENDLTKWNIFKLGDNSISTPHPYGNGWSTNTLDTSRSAKGYKYEV